MGVEIYGEGDMSNVTSDESVVQAPPARGGRRHGGAVSAAKIVRRVLLGLPRLPLDGTCAREQGPRGEGGEGGQNGNGGGYSNCAKRAVTHGGIKGAERVSGGGGGAKLPNAPFRKPQSRPS